MKLAFVINGQGGVGKDTFCDAVAETKRVYNISSITPVKNILRQIGWNGVTKTDKDRRAMSELKRVMIDYNDYPTKYCLEEFKKFMSEDNDYEVMFIHMREPNEIKKFIDATDHRCLSLLIRRPAVEREFGNPSDDGVMAYEYDYVFFNECELTDLEWVAGEFINGVEKAEMLKASPHEIID